MIKITVSKIALQRQLKTLRIKIGDQIVNGLWTKLSRFFKNIVSRLFKGQSLYGVNAWPKISPTLYGHIRYSSDGRRVGRYNSSSQPNIAGGSYFKSFKQLVATYQTMKYGSDHPKANLIINGGWNRKSGFRPRMPLPNPSMPLFLQDIGRVADSHFATIVREVMNT